MADREIAFEVPQGLFEQSVERLRAAGVDAAEKLLEATLRASALDALETVGGVGPVPTALSDVRAARLLELCKLRGEILPDEAVAALFRIMPSSAALVTRRMQATYEASLQEPLQLHMVAMAKLSFPKKDAGEAPRHKLTFATAAAFAYALKRIAAAGLLGEVSTDRNARSIEFPQQVESSRDGEKTKVVKIAADILGIE
jgi:hypothetical protein